jgi:hypothetical protein
MDFSIDAALQADHDRLRAFVRDEIVPLEAGSEELRFLRQY